MFAHREHRYNITALVIVDHYLRRRFAHFEVITHFLDLESCSLRCATTVSISFCCCVMAD